MSYIYQRSDWPDFHWDAKTLLPVIGELRNLQGVLVGKVENLGFDTRNEANLQTLSQEILKSYEIEGEVLDTDQVRSSIAVRLGLEQPGLAKTDARIEGVADVMLDATKNFDVNLTSERLLGWHHKLFPSELSNGRRILVGSWRNDSTGPMQVVSGPMGMERLHFQAPPAADVSGELQQLFKWLDFRPKSDPVLVAAIAHLWFLTIHPFDDGNGRIARAITDLLLARSDRLTQRFYSMSARIKADRAGYYDILEETQKGSLDITEWLLWFFGCLQKAILDSLETTKLVVRKHSVLSSTRKFPLNQRQLKMLEKLLDGFTGKLTSSKWAKICKCSTDTALRDIQYLVKCQILVKAESGGRSTHYELRGEEG